MKPSSMKSRALRFVLLIGVMSFFADFTYEGLRGMIGSYLALLGASALTVALVTGFGEFIGYAWRLVSGSLSDKTRQFWPITIFGYVIQMASVPLLALVGNWQLAAVLIILERFGRATRNPPRDVMLSHAGKEMGGYGRVFGFFWFLGSAVIGVLYEVSLPLLIIFILVVELAAIPMFFLVRRRLGDA